jgi:serine/threonine-protein kinase
VIRKLLRGIAKTLLFVCFLLVLAVFSGMATIRYIFAVSQVEIPDLVGKEIEFAHNVINERHLEVKMVDRQLDPKIPKDHVIAQTPAPGTKVQKNQTVHIVVSKGTETFIIPDTIGKPWQEARGILSKNSFRLGHVAYAHSDSIPVDHVVAQTPLPYIEANSGTSVDLLVSRGSYRAVMVMPDLVGQQLPYGLQVIEALGLVLNKVEHEEYGQILPNTILSQVPKPGTLIEEQNMVTFVVSGEVGRREFIQAPPTASYQALEYVVPPGRYDREVSVVVKNIQGVTEIFHQFVPPGEKVVVRIPVIGETVIEISLDGALETIERLSAP